MSDPRPPKSPRKGKYVNIRIAFLNDTVHVFQVPVKGVGSLLWNAVVNHLQLLEADYFDLEYTNHNGDDCWLDKDKNVLKQIGSPDIPLRFCVKFYTPDPGLLEDELTRYLFALQVRKDLLRGELRCSENTAALLASYIVQGEIGDFDLEEYPDPTYLAVFKFVPEHLQTHEFMAKVMEYHGQHIGESPSEADLNLLDTARKVELYGVKMQTAKDHEGVALNLAVAHLGVLVFQHYTKINTFSWAKVRKLSFKRKKFLIKLHADTYGYYKDTVEFFFETRDRCKLFWKRCIEHHAFFRCQVVAKVPRNKTRVVSRGSSFRYCGRTQKQLVEYVRENIGKRPHFERSTSGRISSRSTSVTPKISSKPGMHSSSADLHTSSGSRSSGSHILDSNHTPGSGVTRDHSATPHSAMRVESVDVHSDSSMSGSRSLNSPRLEHGLSIDQDVIEAVNARTEGAMTDEEDEEERVKKTDGQAPEGMSHVASETKGAHSLLSPELNSPVRYVGLYSEVGSPMYQGDDLASPDVDNSSPSSERPRVVSPAQFMKEDSCDQSLPCSSDATPGPTSVRASNVKTNTSDSAVCPDDGSHVSASDLSNQVPRPNLDLQLTNIASSSLTTSCVTSPPDHDPPTKPRPPPLSQHRTKSPITPSTPPHTSKPATTTPSHSQTTPTTSPPQLTTVSASQNANDVVSERPVENRESELGDNDVSSMKQSSVHPSVNVKTSESAPESRKVSAVDTGQQRRQSAPGMEEDLSPPFPSPPPPLSPQYFEEDMKRGIVVSPSSCVTDTAQSLTDQKVRLSSRVSSLDSNKSTPSPDNREKSLVSPSSQLAGQQLETTFDKGVSETVKVTASPQRETTFDKDDHETTETTTVEQKETTFDKQEPKATEATAEKTKTTRTTPEPSGDRAQAEGSLPTAEAKSEKVDMKKKVPNGSVVGAAKPDKQQLEPGAGTGRKFSAGTDLIEDIPYILHRRLDGHKEETAVYKVSEADKLKRQRSAGPSTKSGAGTGRCRSAVEHPAVERSKSSERRSQSPEVGVDSKLESHSAGSTGSSGSGKSKTSGEKSPTLNRRFEFVSVHKLPSRNSYSSVDDTTSPSGEEGMLKQLEHSSSAKTSPSKSADAHTEQQKDKEESVPFTSDTKTEAETRDEGTERLADANVISVSDGEKTVCKTDDTVPDEASKDDSSKQQETSTLDDLPKTVPAPLEKQESVEEGARKQSLVSDGSVFSENVQFYSPKIPGTQRFKKFISTSASDESPESAAIAAGTHILASSSTSSENVSDMILDDKKFASSDAASRHQYFEVSKPQAYLGRDTSDNAFDMPGTGKDAPKSLPLKTSQSKPAELPLDTFGNAQSSPFSSSEDKAFQPADSKAKSVSASHRAPCLSAQGRTSTSSTSSSSETNQFLIDLPSPAAALFYNDSESPPPFQAETDENANATLTFSTFRPDPAEEALTKTDEGGKEKGKGLNRWSLQSVEEGTEATDFKVIMAEGVVEKSALKKRTSDEADRPKEPKRVSWHEDSDIQHSYHSDLSMTAQRSPVDECDVTTQIDSGDILETLENLRRQNSESDMTNSGSSDVSSDGSDLETESNAKQAYIRYAASKGLNPSKDGDSGVGGMSERSGSQGRDVSPLESLERLGSMDGSGSSFGSRRLSTQDSVHKAAQDSSPLEPLEKLSSLRVDNFDDEGEADDEDDEPNFPPPPPILDIPEEMLVSYESDLPLPPTADPLEGATSSLMATSALAYSSDSDEEAPAAAHGTKSKRISMDPLARLEFGDLVADVNYTTSESESDFDADEANLQLRRMSASNIGHDLAALGDARQRSYSDPKGKPVSGKSVTPTVQKVPEKPEVLPKPSLAQRQTAQAVQGGQQSTHVVQKSQPHRSGPPPPVHPKPQAPPPVQPKPGPVRQPQMGKGKHFERSRHKSSSSTSSSSSASESRHPPPAPHPS